MSTVHPAQVVTPEAVAPPELPERVQILHLRHSHGDVGAEDDA